MSRIINTHTTYAYIYKMIYMFVHKMPLATVSLYIASTWRVLYRVSTPSPASLYISGALVTF